MKRQLFVNQDTNDSGAKIGAQSSSGATIEWRGGTQLMSSDIPNWSDMPESKGVCTLSWKDVYAQMVNNGMTPTKEEIRDNFEQLADTMSDMSGGGDEFWSRLDRVIDNQFGKYEYALDRIHADIIGGFDECQAHIKEYGGFLYTQVDGDDNERIYVRGNHWINRTGVYAVIKSDLNTYVDTAN